MPFGVDHSADRLAHRLREARNRAFVGRSVELALFRSALAGDAGSFPVLFLHGPGGIGKSTLLRRFGDEARAAERPVVELDANTITPSADAFEAAVGQVLRADGAVLLVDNVEHVQELECWLREQFLPRLPIGAVAVLASRQRPSVRWRTDPGWDEALRIVALRDLAPEDAIALLTARGVAPRLHESVLAFAGGHPLALRLAAEDAVRDESRASWTPTRDVQETLLAQLMCEVPSALHRRALEISAHALATTEELLRTVMPDADAGALFTWLRQLSFIQSGQHGLHPLDVLRDALDADLRWRDPQGYQAMHYQIRAHVLERGREASGTDVLPAMAALTYLHRGGGVMPEFLTWQTDGDVVEDQVRPEDRTTVLRLAAEAEGAESAAVVRFWLDRAPEAFRVHRRPATGEPVGFMALDVYKRQTSWPGCGWPSPGTRRSRPTRWWPRCGSTCRRSDRPARESTSGSPGSWSARPTTSARHR